MCIAIYIYICTHIDVYTIFIWIIWSILDSFHCFHKEIQGFPHIEHTHIASNPFGLSTSARAKIAKASYFTSLAYDRKSGEKSKAMNTLW